MTFEKDLLFKIFILLIFIYDKSKSLNEYKRLESELNVSIKDNSNQLDVNSQEG